MSANFAPYQPPPDVPSEDPPSESSRTLSGKNKGKQKRPWFNRDASSYGGNTYQSGSSYADPTSRAEAYSNDPEAAGLTGGFSSSSGGMGGIGSSNGDQERANAWESRFGWRVDVMAAATYIGGPISALIFLILETQNDYVRFHAYQSALLTTPLLLIILLFRLLIPLPTFLVTIIIVGSIVITLFTSFRAFKDAQEGLGRFYLPFIGEMAEKWVSEE